MVHRDGECPACGRPFGRIEETEIEGVPARRYWHTDLLEVTDYCIEDADGGFERVQRGKVAAKV